MRNIRPSHQRLARTALCWIATVHTPLRVAELIEACIIDVAGASTIDEDQRLRPFEMGLLLRHLVVFDKATETAVGASSTISEQDYIVFAHFSVKEYLTAPTYMAAEIRPVFALNLEAAHREVAGGCIAYLLSTNTIARRHQSFPLRSYAWDSWAFHAIAKSDDLRAIAEVRARDLYEQVAFHGVESNEDLNQIIRWASSRADVLHCLRHPYFFDEYTDACSRDDANRAGICSTEFDMVYFPLDEGKFRLLHIHPSANAFAAIRCSMTVASLGETTDFEAISYAWGSSGSKHIWVNGGRAALSQNGENILRSMREYDDQYRSVWLDAVCINQTDLDDRSSQVASMGQLYASARAVAIGVDEPTENEIWALEILRLTERLLHSRSEGQRRDLRYMLSSRPSLDPFLYMASLFRRQWWSRAWMVQEAVLGHNQVILYGRHTLPLIELQNFVSQKARSCRLITEHASDRRYDVAALTATLEWQNVMGLVQILNDRAQNRASTPIQVLYRTRHRTTAFLADRFWSFYSLLPEGHPGPDYTQSNRDSCIRFCKYLLDVSQNLDLFTLLSIDDLGYADEEARLPSWTGYCVSSDNMDHPQPLLLAELEGEAEGPFLSGGHAFSGEMTIDDDRLILQGYVVDKIARFHEDPSVAQAGLQSKGHAQFSRNRAWYRGTSGHEILAGDRAKLGHYVAVLLGGKTPYILEETTSEEYRFVCEWYVSSAPVLRCDS